MKKGVWILIILVIVAAAGIAYFSLFSSKTCTDLDCFNSYLSQCSKAEYIFDGEDATWLYRIEGSSNEKCEIYTELKQVKRGKLDIELLQGQSMNCFLPLGVVDFPEKDITKCHGQLKEGLQETIIQKLHQYIVNNLGQIDEELEKAV